MGMRSNMFLVEPTVIDHAYIDTMGRVVGGSFNPDFIIGGEVDPVEKVVVDFSTVKKKIKALIDDRENGFDHKLWIIKNCSNARYELSDDGQRIRIATPYVDLSLPRNAVKILELATCYTDSEIGAEFSSYLRKELNQAYKGVNVSVSVVNKARPQLMGRDMDGRPLFATAHAMFTYVHGLKDSTSWGCQNNSHGHLSFVQVFAQESSAAHLKLQGVASRIANYLDGTVFINRANLVSTHPHLHEIEYTTERGLFKAKYDDQSIRVVILDTETTIEYLVEFVLSVFRTELEKAGVHALYVSEGLSKGAMVIL